jgi:leader peptidase (prepilin peptidase) / N-methyltransferase
MTILGGEAVALGTAAAGWHVAHHAARRRALFLGAPPLAALAALAVVTAARPPADAVGAIVLGGVAVAAIADARTGFVFTPLTLLLGLAALLAATVDGGAARAGSGMLVVGGTLFALHALTAGRGIGLGDVRLGCAVGAAFGAIPGLIALAWAFVLGGAYGSILLVTGRAKRGSEIPFAPFIAVATIVASGPGLSP